MSLVGNFFSDASEWTTDLVNKGVDLIYGKDELEHIVSYDMQMHFLYNQMVSAENDEDAEAEFSAHMSRRIFFSSLFDEVYPDFEQMNAVTQPEDYDCLRFMIGVTEENCGRLDDYTL